MVFLPCSWAPHLDEAQRSCICLWTQQRPRGVPRLLAESHLWLGGLLVLCRPLVSSPGGWAIWRQPQEAMQRCPSQLRRPLVYPPVLCCGPGGPVDPVLLPHCVPRAPSWVLRPTASRH